MKRQKEKEMKNNKEEKCVICGKDTGYVFSEYIQNRRFYVEGAGQVCKQCFIEIYFKIKDRR